ncbi:hypothetical protein LY28_00213 [Ruminiclostridium sufflavum DSM 19573]|uniref:Cyclic nucleotide-binding domain-containing protein n=1 Tax=Ruminiclostridium sufflavum DSM 19573 TaxID=1121337 RepID=A0A318YCJ8_9FIRM|nr:DUF2225 domain-containing protein [Ruminiclostridium sufflavum]PYG90332.1 hypothetical protein LY28_00213 [Ruminiclostridium sufflavum DSM 19573]
MDLELLRSCGTIKRYNTDAVVTLEGENTNEMYFILSGKVGVFLNTFTDDAVKLTELSVGETFGEMSLLDELPRSATVIALEPLSVLEIDRSNFELFISRQPEMAFKMMKAMASRLRVANAALSKAAASSQIPVPANTEPAAAKAVQTNTVKAFFPEGHKTYSLVPAFDSSEYIFEKNVHCPICGNKFLAYGQKVSKLRSSCMDKDLRRRYENFDSLWFNLWTCPECCYSNFYNEFPNLSPSKFKLVTAKLSSILNGQKLVITNDIDVNQLFTKYYLSLYCAEAYKAPNIKLGKIWMNLMWLYRDSGDEAMEKTAAASALSYYQDAYLKCDSELKPETEQQLCIILAELCLLNNKPEDAFKYLMSARKQRGGNRTYAQMAEFRLDELKEKEKSSSN